MPDFQTEYGGYNTFMEWLAADPQAAIAARVNAASAAQGQAPVYTEANPYEYKTFQENLDSAFGVGQSPFLTYDQQMTNAAQPGAVGTKGGSHTILDPTTGQQVAAPGTTGSANPGTYGGPKEYGYTDHTTMPNVTYDSTFMDGDPDFTNVNDAAIDNFQGTGTIGSFMDALQRLFGLNGTPSGGPAYGGGGGVGGTNTNTQTTPWAAGATSAVPTFNGYTPSNGFGGRPSQGWDGWKPQS